MAMSFMRHGYAYLPFEFDCGAVKIFGLGQAPGVRTTVSVEEKRLMFEAFFDLLLERIKMNANAATRHEIVRVNLRYPAELVLVKKSKKRRVVSYKLPGYLQRFISDFAPTCQIRFQTALLIHAP